MGMNGDFLVLFACGLAITSMLLQNNIANASMSRRFYCHGDYCRICLTLRDEPIEFCSMTYKRCRPCSDITDDCLSPDLPRNCSSTCIKYKVGEKIEELQENTCPVLSDINNGKHNGSLTDTHKPGEVIMYICDIGYRLIGASHRECKRYGFWSDDIPTCKEMLCPVLSSVTNGMHNGSSDSLSPGALVVTSCADGHQMYGKNTTVCNSDGLWSNSLPVCIRNVCVQPHPIRNGRWLNSHHTSEWYMSGHTLRAQCEQGYLMEGSSEWNCTDEGYWKSNESPYLPSCFLQGKSDETCSCIAWQVWLGVVGLFVSVLVNIKCLLVQRRLRRINQKDGFMVTKQELIENDIESVVIDDENIRLLDERFISLQEHKQTREKVVSSGARDIPAPNTYNNQSKEPPISNNTDISKETRGCTTVVKIINNNNGINNNNTVENSAISRSAPQSTDNGAFKSTETAPPKTEKSEKAPVEESGISCIPSQPEPPDENLRNQPESPHGTLTSQPESPDGILPSQLEGSDGTLPSQSEPTGGTSQIQPASSSGTLSSQLELSASTAQG